MRYIKRSVSLVIASLIASGNLMCLFTNVALAVEEPHSAPVQHTESRGGRVQNVGRAAPTSAGGARVSSFRSFSEFYSAVRPAEMANSANNKNTPEIRGSLQTTQNLAVVPSHVFMIGASSEAASVVEPASSSGSGDSQNGEKDAKSKSIDRDERRVTKDTEKADKAATKAKQAAAAAKIDGKSKRTEKRKATKIADKEDADSEKYDSRADKAQSKEDKLESKADTAQARADKSIARTDRQDARTQKKDGDDATAKQDRQAEKAESKDAKAETKSAATANQNSIDELHESQAAKVKEFDDAAKGAKNKSIAAKDRNSALTAETAEEKSYENESAKLAKNAAQEETKAESNGEKDKDRTATHERRKANQDELRQQSDDVKAAKVQAAIDKTTAREDKGDASRDSREARKEDALARKASEKGDSTLASADDTKAAQDKANAQAAKAAAKGEKQDASAERSEAEKILLFGINGQPSAEGLAQGEHGDCYLYNVLIWLAKNDPSEIEHMIKKDGKDYKVTFSNGVTETVRLGKDDQDYKNLNGANGRWVDILVAAYAKARAPIGKDGKRDLSKKQMDKILNDGGSARVTLKFFTGNHYTAEHLDKMTDKDLYHYLEGADNGTNNQPVSITTKGHVCSITNFKPDPKHEADSKVTITNPWGSTGWFDPKTDEFRSKAPEGKDKGNWVHMEAGTFTVSLKRAKEMGFVNVIVPKSDTLASSKNTTAASSKTAANVTSTTTSGGSAQAKNDSVDTTVLVAKRDDRKRDARDRNDKKDDKSLAVKAPIEYTMTDGTTLVSHDKPVVLHANGTDVEVAPKAIAFIIKVGDELGVYNLTDSGENGVKVKVAGNEMAVGFGHSLILSNKAENQFSTLNLSHAVEAKDMKLIGTYDGISVFSGGYSYQSAITMCPQFQQFINSKSQLEQNIANRLLKNLAAEQRSEPN